MRIQNVTDGFVGNYRAMVKCAQWVAENAGKSPLAACFRCPEQENHRRRLRHRAVCEACIRKPPPRI